MDYYCYYNGAHSDNAAASDINSLKKKKKKSSKGKSVAPPAKLSTDPQSVAARERRRRISERFKTLQSLIPGRAKLDTVSMLDEAIHYVKFLKTQLWLHETTVISSGSASVSAGAYSKSFQQPQLDELHYPRSIEWIPCSVDDGAAFATRQSSWGYDMAEVQFGNETTPF